MNQRILHKDVQDFIQENVTSDITKLIFKGSPFDEVTIQEIAQQIVGKQKCLQKLPTWFQTENIYFPPKLNLEQTSSETTANYKSSLVKGHRLIDITGGFGVDSVAFSASFDQVIHCEISPNLSKIAKHNFTQLGIQNIETVVGDGLDFIRQSPLRFDCMYVDPSRRNDAKGKVFLLKDCEPNVPENLDIFFEKSDQILIKVSPILDITSAIHELKHVKEVHVVAVLGEVKEVLCLLRKGHSGSIEMRTVNIQKNDRQNFNFQIDIPVESTYSLPKKFLYEPNAAILKSGGFHQVSKQFHVDKLHPHSHLYTSVDLIKFPGRVFKIVETTSYDKKYIKKQLKEGKANITTRNFPKTVQQIRKELKCKDGGHQYLFFTTNIKGQLICIFCEKIIRH